MSIEVIRGNIWDTSCQTLVNTVNCEGVMGAGIALEAKLRYPKMYEKYKEICQQGLMQVGNLWLYNKSQPYWILNFPTKTTWKLPSREEYITKGLEKFVDTHYEKNISSIAFPLLGGLNGKLEKDRVLRIMFDYLGNLDIRIEIYEHDSKTQDKIFSNFRNFLMNEDIEKFSRENKIKKLSLTNLIDELKNNHKICQFSDLLKIQGLGEMTIRKIINSIHEADEKVSEQILLF